MKEPVHDVALEDPISKMALSNCGKLSERSDRQTHGPIWVTSMSPAVVFGPLCRVIQILPIQLHWYWDN